MASDFTKIAAIMCVLVFAREFRPIEPFLTLYLTEPPLNLTTTEVNEKVYPTGTYASLMWVVIVFVVTDYLRYKPIIILDGLAGVMTYALLLGKPSMTLINIEQIFYGFFYASDVVNTTYLYAKIQDASLFQRMTGYVRTSSLVGRFFNGVFSQSMYSLKILKLTALMYASIAGMTFVTAWAFMIPPVSNSIYFHRTEEKKLAVFAGGSVHLSSDCSESAMNTAAVQTQKVKDVAARLWDDFKTAYKNLYVLKWSIWWALSLTVCYFMETYIQVLWQSIAIETNKVQYLWNGAVESISTVLSALGVHLICKTSLNWPMYGDWILALITAALSLLFFYLYKSINLWLAYLAYVAFEILFHSLYTIAQSEVAQHLKGDCFVLIFGFNNFVALCLSSILTYAMIEGKIEFLNFTTRQQFLFFGVYLCVVTIVTCSRAVINLYQSMVKLPNSLSTL